MATLKPQSDGPLYSNTVIGTLAVDRWAVTFGTARGLGVFKVCFVFSANFLLYF